MYTSVLKRYSWSKAASVDRSSCLLQLTVHLHAPATDFWQSTRAARTSADRRNGVLKLLICFSSLSLSVAGKSSN